ERSRPHPAESLAGGEARSRASGSDGLLPDRDVVQNDKLLAANLRARQIAPTSDGRIHDIDHDLVLAVGQLGGIEEIDEPDVRRLGSWVGYRHVRPETGVGGARHDLPVDVDHHAIHGAGTVDVDPSGIESPAVDREDAVDEL